MTIAVDLGLKATKQTNKRKNIYKVYHIDKSRPVSAKEISYKIYRPYKGERGIYPSRNRTFITSKLESSHGVSYQGNIGFVYCSINLLIQWQYFEFHFGDLHISHCACSCMLFANPLHP